MVRKLDTLEKDLYYSLPLETGTLTLDTLNKHSDFRFPKRSYLGIGRRAISFVHEVLTLGISLAEQKEERVYIRVLDTELRISCSLNTDQSYLSSHAYFALYNFVSVLGSHNFSKYFWPGFFDPQTGKSKYLTTIINGLGINIKRKPKYAFFYKPGDQLIRAVKNKNTSPVFVPEPIAREINRLNHSAIGYCLADTRLSSARSNHFPFLVPYTANWKENRQGIRGFQQFLTSAEQALTCNFSPAQQKINGICWKMRMLAPILIYSHQDTERDKQAIQRQNLRSMRQVYLLWQQAVPLLQSQAFTHSLYTFGMANVKGKPVKQNLKPCSFSRQRPQLYFLLLDKGEYYELQMRFKAGGKRYIPNPCNPTFFIHSKTEPYRFYLLEDITDYHVVCFFERHSFKLSVLKCHYQPHFKSFTDRLAASYELRLKG